MLTRLKLLTSDRSARAAGVFLAVTVVTTAALARQAVGPADEGERTVSEALVAFVRASDVSSIATPTALTIADVIVTVGDELGAGQPIARIDHTDVQRELTQLSLDVERASQDVIERERSVALAQDAIQGLVSDAADAAAGLALAERAAQEVPMRQAKDSPDRAQVAYEQASLRARRVEQLAAAGLVAKQDVEDAEFTVRVAADDLANARQAAEAARRVHSAEGVHGRAQRQLSVAEQRRQLADQQAGLKQARLRWRQAQLTYETAARAAAESFVRTPRRGAIIELAIHAGDRLTPGALIAKIAALDPVAVDVDVAPLLTNALHVGDHARIDLPAIGVTGRQGRIQSIAPLPGDQGKYSIRLTLPNPAHARLAGQTAYVTFVSSGVPPRP